MLRSGLRQSGLMACPGTFEPQLCLQSCHLLALLPLLLQLGAGFLGVKLGLAIVPEELLGQRGEEEGKIE